VARLAGVSPESLVGPQVQRQGDRQILHWDREHQGAPIIGDRVALVVVGESIAGVWAQLTPVPARLQPRGSQVIFPLPPRAIPVVAEVHKAGTEVVYRSPSGEVLYRYETRYAATVNLTVEERTVGDPLITVPARRIRVAEGEERWSTDDDGVWEGGSPEFLIFNGESLRVRDNGENITVAAPDPLPEPWVVEAGEEVPHAANTVLHNVHVAWDWLGERWPSHPWLSDHLPATVRSDFDVCNAWYDGHSITFLQEEPGSCNDFGRIADVVFHELGHGVHHRIIATGTYASDVSEGSADFLSATITGDSRVGINAYPDGRAVRNIGPDRRYPEDYIGESHNDGLIWASFLWNLREDWGEAGDAGVRDVEMLFLRTLQQGPTLLDLYEGVLLADDDDGDISTGTPHDCELMARLDEHGIGPGPIGVIRFDHSPLEAQPSAADGYVVDFVLSELTPDCGALDPDSVRIWFSVEEALAPGVVIERFDTGEPEPPDTGEAPDTGEPPDLYLSWESVTPESDGSSWTGLIPRQPANSHVRYFIEAASTDGVQVVRTHDGRADGVWSFWVGDRRALWCDGFEDGGAAWSHGPGLPWDAEPAESWHSEWSFSTPIGSPWGPDAAFSGDLIAVTAVDEEYGNNNRQHLTSPEIDLSAGELMLMLSTRRWLTVEDSIYDLAEVWANETPIWVNPASPSGQAHTLDDAWTQHDVPLEGLIDDPTSVRFHWTLVTDQGLEFGGWALDEVCVITLDDVPGHYQVTDLEASKDAPVISLSWTQPWVRPLRSTILVRKAGEAPLDPLDGEEIERNDAPTPGAVRHIVDADVDLGTAYHYALFTVGPRWDDLTDSLVLGENLAIGMAVSPADTGVAQSDTGIVGDTGADTSDPAPESEAEDTRVPYTPEAAKDGCSCAAQQAGTGRAGGWPWLLLLLGLLRSRRAQRVTPAV
jgi:MYXO-CTERM domain-containing protein